jgi:hypothetical protein
VKRAFLVTCAVLALFAAAVTVAALEPWRSKERDRELAWLEAYDAWSDGIDSGLEGGDNHPAANCETSYAQEVGAPPPRLAEAGRIVRRACASLQRWVASGDESRPAFWLVGVRNEVLGDLTERRTRAAATNRSGPLATYAAPLAGEASPTVFCWASGQWEALSEEWRLIDVDELWPIGFADPQTNRIHLSPEICEPLHRFFGGNYAPNLSEASLDLANALVVLAHEAEHLRRPDASEADVECVAIQRVRDLVRAAGRGTPYENLIAGLAWDVGYPDMPPDYRTTACRDGGELDVRPDTSIWP